MPCPLTMSFFDPLLTEDGEPYAPIRYKSIVFEEYYISRNINMTYEDVERMTPYERKLILKNISDENTDQSEQLNGIIEKANKNKQQ